MKVIPLPDILAKPIFHLIYLLNCRMEGAKMAPILHKVMPVDDIRRQAFDQLLEKVLAGDSRVPMEYDLSFPKSEFLNYIYDWRGYVLHSSPLHDLEVLQPIRQSGDNNEFGNRQQIFASPDAIWAMWFAILDKGKLT